ncbi:hypothetical protein [Kitasatospora sp. NBC_00315]|uniref:hypothetical protein n=1 Tax=Kitasatospora sp. NBC_00315 TaxID=2975963 RepID=UPI00324CFAD8
METPEQWLATYVEQLMRLTRDLDQAAAVAFVREVYEAGREAGIAEVAYGLGESE